MDWSMHIVQTKAMTFAEYFKLFAGDTGFEIGITKSVISVAR